jgi:hypothetical protein
MEVKPSIPSNRLKALISANKKNILPAIEAISGI